MPKKRRRDEKNIHHFSIPSSSCPWLFGGNETEQCTEQSAKRTKCLETKCRLHPTTHAAACRRHVEYEVLRPVSERRDCGTETLQDREGLEGSEGRGGEGNKSRNRAFEAQSEAEREVRI